MINELLLEGEQNATSGQDLCRLLRINPRALTKQINAERRAGYPICATCNGKNPGYYLADNQETMRDYCGRLRHRINEISETLRYCAEAADSLPERGEGL